MQINLNYNIRNYLRPFKIWGGKKKMEKVKKSIEITCPKCGETIENNPTAPVKNGDFYKKCSSCGIPLKVKTNREGKVIAAKRARVCTRILKRIKRKVLS